MIKLAVMMMFNFENYRLRMGRLGGGIREANKRQSEQIMEKGFDDSQTVRQVRVDGKEYDARIITDSKTTVRGGNGNHVIQFKNNLYLQAGTYIEIPDAKGEYHWWLCLYESDSTLFPKHIIKKCNYLLRWKNRAGDIVERWVVFSDNNKLMDAERKTFYNKMTISYYSNSLILPCDEETINVRIDKRFLIDHEKVDDNPDAWIVTNRNVISKRFDEYEGVIELAIARHQFNHNVDSRELMIANYYQVSDVVEDVDDDVLFDCRISYSASSNLRMGTPFKNYYAEFFHNGVLQEAIIGIWDVIIPDGMEDLVTYEIDGNLLRIKCKSDGAFIGSHIRLIVTSEEFGCSAELPIKVVSTL